MWDRSDIRERMVVVGSCGERVGIVDRVEGDWLKLSRDLADNEIHFIPLDWVETVDTEVALSRPAEEVLKQWQYDVVIAPG